MSGWWGHLIGVLILVMMAVFIGIWFWAWRPRHRRVFDALAEIPMLDGGAAADGGGGAENSGNGGNGGNGDERTSVAPADRGLGA